MMTPLRIAAPAIEYPEYWDRREWTNGDPITDFFAQSSDQKADVLKKWWEGVSGGASVCPCAHSGGARRCLFSLLMTGELVRFPDMRFIFRHTGRACQYEVSA
jgi:hypothetical protein